MSEWPDTVRRGYTADMNSAVGLMNADIRIDNLKRLLSQALAVADSGHWRDKAGLNLKAHPLWDEIRSTT